jgi:hypothetical protein
MLSIQHSSLSSILTKTVTAVSLLALHISGFLCPAEKLALAGTASKIEHVAAASVLGRVGMALTVRAVSAGAAALRFGAELLASENQRVEQGILSSSGGD